MNIKVDENIGQNGVEFLQQHGHDVMTVGARGLGGAPDSTIFGACVEEGRALVTLDRDFGFRASRPNGAPAL